MAIKIDPEFRDIIPPLTKPEFEQLELNLIEEGCRERIITWNNYVIDGHNRFNICSKHDLEYEILELNHFEDRHAVIDWMIQNQIGKRNLSGGTISYLRGLKLKRAKQRKLEEEAQKMELEAMNAPAEPENVEIDGEEVEAPEAVTDQVEAEEKPKVKPDEKEMLKVIREHEEKIAEEVAKMYQVSPSTLKKDEKFTEAVHTIRDNVGREIQDKILSKELKLNPMEVMSISKMEKEKQQELMTGEDDEILERLAEVKREKQVLNHKKTLIKLEQRLLELNALNVEGTYVLESDDEQVYLLNKTDDGEENLVHNFKGTGKVDGFLDGFIAAVRLIVPPKTFEPSDAFGDEYDEDESDEQE